ncbi:MAG: hypothetical protein Q4P28_03830 [Tissierellia bacterium]|nr:hypothetical protein [Tissierellia bacterium]
MKKKRNHNKRLYERRRRRNEFALRMLPYRYNVKKRKNTHPLLVSCGHCKTPIAIYQKGGKGNLIKMQFPRILESAIDIRRKKGHFQCPNCRETLAKRGDFHGTETYWILRGKVNTKILSHYE